MSNFQNNVPIYYNRKFPKRYFLFHNEKLLKISRKQERALKLKSSLLQTDNLRYTSKQDAINCF
jgi:hypothetical protein